MTVGDNQRDCNFVLLEFQWRSARSGIHDGRPKARAAFVVGENLGHSCGMGWLTRFPFPLVRPAAPILGALLFTAAAAPVGEPSPDAYWRQPLAPQGQAPARWSRDERSLAPRDCGKCHAEQFAQWSTSRHAQAFSPGVVGQLLDYDAADAAACMQCHAPLDEQRVAFEAARARGGAHKPREQGLAAAGNACAGCHLRAHARFGPPRRGTGATGPSVPSAPHGGVFRTALFETSEFCSACHQFPAALAVAGKPLENTYAEWQASPQAARGMSCQTCHMPDRRHLWRGIHDPEMVASGLTSRASADADKARFEITNTGVAHAFPTYATPTVVMLAIALDAGGAERRETLRSHVIARRVRHDGQQWQELADTRLLPGQSAAIEMPWNGSDRVRIWLEVIPDDFYATEVYPGLLARLTPDSAPAQLIATARDAAAASRFRLFETELRRP
jgi:cytochrome c554/c'-like protein